MTNFSVSTTSTTEVTLTGDDTLNITASGQLKPSGPAVTWALGTAQGGAGVAVTNSGSIAPTSTSGRVFDTSGSATGANSFSLTNNAGASITGASNIMRDPTGRGPVRQLRRVQSAATQSGLDVIITLNAANTITLSGVTLASLNSGDFLFV